MTKILINDYECKRAGIGELEERMAAGETYEEIMQDVQDALNDTESQKDMLDGAEREYQEAIVKIKNLNIAKDYREALLELLKQKRDRVIKLVKEVIKDK